MPEANNSEPQVGIEPTTACDQTLPEAPKQGVNRNRNKLTVGEPAEQSPNWRTETQPNRNLSPDADSTPAPRPEALPAGPFYHGGKRGLGPGDWLVPSPPHKADGCPICVARAEGRSFTVGEMRAWAARIGGQQAERLLAQLECADDAEPIDPPTGQQAVYVTSDRDYAAWYAARSEGDLYRVTPVGAVTASPEDHFPTWTCARARVLEVVRRKVRLRDRERRRLQSRWKDADAAALAAVERASQDGGR